jgi:steroid 5-alpha reductase family enzyme
MSGHLDVIVGVAIGIVVVMVATWVVSLPLRNASIVDIVWGAGFVMVAWVARTIGDGNADRIDLLTAMVTIWGGRLALYLWWRNHGKGEDFRYQSMRRRHGDRFPVRSLVTVFGLQGVVMFVVSLPVQLAATPASPGIGWLAVAGVVLWGVGLFFETVGDAQLARFKADPTNAGTVMDRGLWRYTRHPNYFGDFCVWWGVFLVAAEASDARFGVVGPVLMSFMLLRVSGVAMLERGLVKRREGYADYMARTATFFPRPPKRLTTDV